MHRAFAWHSRKHSPLEPGVSARRWIGRLRLHAGKYILGITAPTGTGVQARHHSPAHSRGILLKLFDADVAKPSWTEVQPWDILAAYRPRTAARARFTPPCAPKITRAPVLF